MPNNLEKKYKLDNHYFPNAELCKLLKTSLCRRFANNIKLTIVPKSILLYPIPLTLHNYKVPLKGVGPKIQMMIEKILISGNYTIDPDQIRAKMNKILPYILNDLDKLIIDHEKKKKVSETHDNCNTTKTSQPRNMKKKMLKSIFIKLEDFSPKILIDNREIKRSRDIQDITIDLDPKTFEFFQLSVGDVVWCIKVTRKFENSYKIPGKPKTDFEICIENKHKYYMIPCIIERKSEKDLHSSIIDGRYKNQITRIKKYIQMNLTSFIEPISILLCEMTKDKRNLNLKAIRTALIHYTLYHNISILYSKSLKNSSKLIGKIHLYLTRKMEDCTLTEIDLLTSCTQDLEKLDNQIESCDTNISDSNLEFNNERTQLYKRAPKMRRISYNEWTEKFSTNFNTSTKEIFFHQLRFINNVSVSDALKIVDEVYNFGYLIKLLKQLTLITMADKLSVSINCLKEIKNFCCKEEKTESIDRN